MNQTTWIVGGGALILAVAFGLYMWTGHYESGKVAPATDAAKTVNTTSPIVEDTTLTPTSAQDSSPATPAPAVPAAVSSAVISTSMGDITVKFYGSDAPKTVANFAKLAKEGFYNGVKFHRVIKDFMIQSGDPKSKNDALVNEWGTGGPGYQFADEFNPHKLVRGSLAMANSGPNTNGSQFFIVTAAATPWLDGKHTNFGEVTDGMDVVLKIGNTQTGINDRPTTPVVIKSITVQ